jgi:hypothetical protein
VYQFMPSRGAWAVVISNTAAPLGGLSYEEPLIMIDFAKSPTAKTPAQRQTTRRRAVHKQQTPAWHAGYLQLLPAILRQARHYLKPLKEEAFEDALQEILADTVVVYARLAELGREQIAFSGPLVRYAVAKFRAGRRVGSRLNVRDIMSPHCQQRKRVCVERLHRFNNNSGDWRELLVEDRHASPAEVAAIRVDFSEWLQSLSPRNRQIAERLAIGETSGRVARMFSVSTSRISQLRKEFCCSRRIFIGADVVVPRPAYSNAAR